MNIKDLINKFEGSPPDRTLARNLEIVAKVAYIPKEPLTGEYIKLSDETGELEAVSCNRKIFNLLLLHVDKGTIFKLKGRLDKTEFGNIAFEIEEIIE